MGGFHVVELPILLTEANTEAAPTENTHTVTEKGRYPSEKRPECRVTILILENLRKLVKDPDFEIQTTEVEITNRSKGDALSISILQSTWFILQCVGRRIQGLNLTHLELTHACIGKPEWNYLLTLVG